ncbi:MAG: ribonuclease D [Rhodospirillaceae bacterium]|nr:ribonuclease D [Rhodospirillaceae bacterium]MBT5514812.1 ribonuclease D [Rhodospirillaceae bacterium]MBT6086738.1 ribonuclease D [Rhodospirillaceae bacterium]MBT6610375.1 ribonuclease D [Rhodospirillaceae bacterium]MBT6885375.1 ribonuclease D [Rhodospirillaceae bacterium]
MPKPAKREAKSIELHKGDLPVGVSFGDSVAVDTETQGLNPLRDRLCVIQLSAGDGVCHLVQFAADDYDAPNLRALLSDTSVSKIFHFARFDVAIIKRYLGVNVAPLFCTKIASKLVRTYTDRHGLKDVTRELLNIELSKEQQSSDWAAAELSPEQLKYAAADVLNLHDIRAQLQMMLEREDRMALAEACFEFLATRAELDLGGWSETDIFAH